MFAFVAVGFATGAELTPEQIAAAEALKHKNAMITLVVLAVVAVLFIT